MTSSTIPVIDNDRMDSPTPVPTALNVDAPSRRGQARPPGRLRAGLPDGDGGAYLRREGLYSSLISEWRRQRDAGVLDGKRPGEKVGKLTAEQAEIARLKRELERANKRLATTETALFIMGKAHSLLEHSPRARTRTNSARSADARPSRAHRRPV